MADFSASSARRIARQVKKAERTPPPQPRRARYPVAGGPVARYAKTGAAGIPARSGATLGHATVTLYRKDPTTRVKTLTDETVVCCNDTTGAVAADADVVIMLDETGEYTCIVENC